MANPTTVAPPVACLGTLAGKWEVCHGDYADLPSGIGTPLLYLRRRRPDTSGLVVGFDTVVGGSPDVDYFVRAVLQQVTEDTATLLLQAATGVSAPAEGNEPQRVGYWVQKGMTGPIEPFRDDIAVHKGRHRWHVSR